MKDVFPWTEKQAEELLRGFSGNTPFQVNWPWASFHFTGFQALRWAAYNDIGTGEFYNILDNLSAPSAPKKYFKRLKRSGLLDLDDRIVPLDPALTIRKTFKLSKERIDSFKNQDVVLLTVDDLLQRDPSLTTSWKPLFREDSDYVKKWLSKEPSLLNTFQCLGFWDQLKVVECLVGVAKPLSVLNFERIY